MNRMSMFVMGAAIGCAAGALAALAVASRGNAQAQAAGDGQSTIASVRDRGTAVLKGAKDKICSPMGKDVKVTGNSSSDDLDPELRAKIEQARERIAAQVAQRSKE